jgi:hypothetical protein
LPPLGPQHLAHTPCSGKPMLSCKCRSEEIIPSQTPILYILCPMCMNRESA